MTDEERNKIIAEALGLCWHEGEATQFPHRKCKPCGEVIIGIKKDGTEHDFSTWPGFGIIMEEGPGKDWWYKFWFAIKWKRSAFGPIPGDWFIRYIHPVIMFAELSTWLSENKK